MYQNTIKFLLIGLFSFYFTNIKAQTNTDLAGDWKIEIDRSLDGVATGNLGCNVLTFIASSNGLTGKYKNCNYPSIHFEVKILKTNRGTLLQITQNNLQNNYTAIWAGHLVKKDNLYVIEGLWTDVEGQKGDFKLSKTN